MRGIRITKALFVLLLGSLTFASEAQSGPGFGYVDFKLYSGEQPVSWDQFRTEYRCGIFYGITFSPLQFGPLNARFDTASKYIKTESNKIDAEICTRTFVHSGDTMILLFKGRASTNNYYTIRHLEFKKGRYFLDSLNLNLVNFRRAELDYYNYVLDLLKKMLGGSQCQPCQLVKNELLRLKRQYRIDEADNNPKKLSDIHSKH